MIAVMLEDALHLVLLHANLHTAHNFLVSLRADLAHILEHFNLLLRLDDSALHNIGEESLGIHCKLVDPLKVGRLC